MVELQRANLTNIPIRWAPDSTIQVPAVSVFLRLHDGSYLIHDRKENCIIRIEADRMAIGGRTIEFDKVLHEASRQMKEIGGPAYANYVSFKTSSRETMNCQQARIKIVISHRKHNVCVC